MIPEDIPENRLRWPDGYSDGFVTGETDEQDGVSEIMIGAGAVVRRAGDTAFVGFVLC